MAGARGTAIVGGLVAGAALLLGASSWTRVQRLENDRASRTERDRRTPSQRGGEWLGSGACRSCHPEEHASWHDTFHRTMTQRVSPETVIAPFDGRALAHRDGEHAVERRGDEFWVRMPDPQWLTDRALGRPVPESGPDPAWERTVMSTGAHHMQMYWVALGAQQTLVAFPFTWLTDLERWVPNESTLLRPSEDEVVYAWNRVCIKCHAVAGIPGGSEGDDGFETRVAELGIACESCHGPGGKHVRAHQDPLHRYRARLDESADDIVNPAKLDGRRAAAVCAQCHAASVFEDEAGWLTRGLDETAREALQRDLVIARHPVNADQPWLETLLESDPDYVAGRFWADGMMRISGRDYNGVLEAPCFSDEDFTCTTCHQMHGSDPDDQLRTDRSGDQVCSECHPGVGGVEHTRHEAGTTECVDCHMPPTVYGLLKAIRSHQIDSPDVGDTVDWGRPNACNACHLDRSLRWTANALHRGWNVAPPSFEGEPDADAPAGLLWALRGDAGQRALAAWYLGWAKSEVARPDRWSDAVLAELLVDDYDAVRLIAERSLRSTGDAVPERYDVLGAGHDTAPLQVALTERAMGSFERENLRGFAPGTEAWNDLRRRRNQRIVDLRE
jgi:predicted CXXCH cytochrome family protein